MFAWILIPLGFVVIYYAEAIFNFFGEIELAERYMPAGGTPGFIKLLGLIISFAGLTWIIGGGDTIRSIIQPFTL